MKKIFDAHIHHLFEMPIDEAVRIFSLEFPRTNTQGYAFMSVPNQVSHESGFYLDEMQNIRILYLKHVFSPTAYAFAGLEHLLNFADMDSEYLSFEYLRQAEEYHKAGFDGIKMLEGYPSSRKVMKRPLCDGVYDRFYSYLEENGIPVTMHVANPEENWDISKADAYAFESGRVYDSTYPTRLELLSEVDRVMQKHPKLRIALAHFGFMSYDIEMARHWMSYENTMFDITPGGEQLINMQKNWEQWEPFFNEYQDRIVYGSDYYAFPQDENWEQCFMRRPKFLSEFFETDTYHDYLGTAFKGVAMDEGVLKKIYWDNSIKRLGKPNKIDITWIKSKAENLLLKKGKYSKYADEDLRYILKALG